MDFANIAPRTHEEFVVYDSALSQSSNLEDAQKKLPEKLLLALEEEMKDKNLNFEDASKSIKSYLNNLKDIKIYLAFEPSHQFREKLINTLSYSFKNHVMEFVVDSSVIGGVKMAIDGKFFDKALSSLLG